MSMCLLCCESSNLYDSITYKAALHYLELQPVMPSYCPLLCIGLLHRIWRTRVLAKPPELLPQVVHALTKVYLQTKWLSSATCFTDTTARCTLLWSYMTLCMSIELHKRTYAQKQWAKGSTEDRMHPCLDLHCRTRRTDTTQIELRLG